MATLGWKPAKHTPQNDDQVIVQVSKLMLRSYRDVPGFLRAALAIRRTVLDQRGAVGLSLKAQLVGRTFWTLSAWENEDALREFMRSDSHREVMTRYRGRMAGSHFHTWYSTGPGELPPSWKDGIQRANDDEASSKRSTD